jgi:hypothetical protein
MLRAARWNEKIIIRAKAVERAEKLDDKLEIVESALAVMKRNDDHTATDNFLNEIFIYGEEHEQMIHAAMSLLNMIVLSFFGDPARPTG